VSTICIVAAGHISSCPRLLKAARALSAAGHRVRVVSATMIEELRGMEIALVGGERWEWDPVDWHPDRAWYTWARTGARQRAAQRAAGAVGADRVPYAVAVAAFDRLHVEIAERAARLPADLYYGGASGAIAAAAEAASRNGAPFAIDVEDFHAGEAPAGSTRQKIVERVEQRVLPRAAFVTAGSPAIADAYRAKYGIAPIAVCNTFELPVAPPSFVPSGGPGLRLYWFSQTIGPGRGLETVIDALGAARAPGELYLRGFQDEAHVPALRVRAAERAPLVRLEILPVDAPDRMVDRCRGYDVGLSVEPGSSINNALALSNKALTYPLAGLALALTDTPGQRPLIDDLKGDAIVFAPGDVGGLARQFASWSRDKSLVQRAMRASWQASTRRWRWDGHDRETLLNVVEEALNSATPQWPRRPLDLTTDRTLEPLNP
jgi:hypothetical protein